MCFKTYIWVRELHWMHAIECGYIYISVNWVTKFEHIYRTRKICLRICQWPLEFYEVHRGKYIINENSLLIKWGPLNILRFDKIFFLSKRSCNESSSRSDSNNLRWPWQLLQTHVILFGKSMHMTTNIIILVIYNKVWIKEFGYCYA